MQPVNAPCNKARSAYLGMASAIVLAAICTPRTDADGLGQAIRVPGGVPGYPIITSISLPSRNTDNATVHWSGFGGPFQIQSQPSLSDPWQPIGNPTFTLSNTVPTANGNLFFRVSAPSPLYAGAATCKKCHGDTHEEWSGTRHAGAFDALKAIHQETNANCLACHTVGFGLPTGFKAATTTTQLAAVECENCHGPAGDHASDPFGVVSPVLRPQAEMCGGCHTAVHDPTYQPAVHHPTYEEWESSRHARVTPDVAGGLLNPTSGVAQMKSCGPCHSGAVRLAMVANVEDGVPLVFPSGEEAATLPITCVVCHDPMANTDNGAQLRYPTASMDPYSYTTSATNTFAAQYNPSINVCGQCHNLRGAAWTDTSRSPHQSPQYSILIGSGGVGDGVAPQSPHRDITNQCVTCHMHPQAVAEPSAEPPAYRAHDFAPQVTSCQPCHDAEEAAVFKNATQTYTQQRIGQIKALLDRWATTKAPDPLRAKYGVLAWEYTNVGDLSTPTATVPNGPTGNEQAAVADGIKQARYNVYLVAHDQSLGVHNGRYTRYLLKVAEDKVNAELAR